MKFVVEHVLQYAEWQGPLQRLGQKQTVRPGAEVYRCPPRYHKIQYVFVDEADQVVFLAHDAKDNIVCIQSVHRVYSIYAALVQCLQALDYFVPLVILNIVLMNSLNNVNK